MIYMAIANVGLAFSLVAVVAMWLFSTKKPKKDVNKRYGNVVEKASEDAIGAKFAAKEIENFLSYNGDVQGEIEIE